MHLTNILPTALHTKSPTLNQPLFNNCVEIEHLSYIIYATSVTPT